jgi:hypothetical protein
MNVDVDRLVRETERCLAELERVSADPFAEFDTSLIPHVHWLA